MAQIGKLPKSLKYYCKQREVTVNGASALPTFVVDADSSNMCDTANRWANIFDYQNNKYIHPIIMFYANDPIKDVVIVDLEKRSEGGRAYKVIFELEIGRAHV